MKLRRLWNQSSVGYRLCDPYPRSVGLPSSWPNCLLRAAMTCVGPPLISLALHSSHHAPRGPSWRGKVRSPPRCLSGSRLWRALTLRGAAPYFLSPCAIMHDAPVCAGCDGLRPAVTVCMRSSLPALSWASAPSLVLVFSVRFFTNARLHSRGVVSCVFVVAHSLNSVALVRVPFLSTAVRVCGCLCKCLRVCVCARRL